MAYYRTEEEYDCPQSLNSFVEMFSSLQYDIRACSGDVNDPASLENTCKLCDHYIKNAEKRDREEVDMPISH